MASKLVISARSAHANQCKRSVHVNEIVRRMMNTSRKLDWDTFCAPVISEYMLRMKRAGYGENYRKHVLLNAFAVYDSKIQKDLEGECQLNRPSGYRKAERRKEKLHKKRNWSTKGGFVAPIIVPATPNGELAKMLKTAAESEPASGIKFKIIEKGGKPLGKIFQNSNPTASGKCGKENCYMDNQVENGKMCHKSNVLYEWQCRSCDSKYIGETSRNFFTRSLEHVEKANQKAADSFINNHQIEAHNGDQPSFSTKILKSFKDPLSRQVYEGVYIRNCSGNSLNTKMDYYQTSTYRMRREILHG